MTNEEKAATRHALSVHIKKTGAPFAWGFTPRMSPAFAAGILAIALGAGITRAAENALPGDTLFPLKVAKERVFVAFAPNAEEKIVREADLARKRLDEISQLAMEDRLTDKAATAAKKNLVSHIANAQMRINLLADAHDSHEAAKLHSSIESTLAAYDKIIDWISVKQNLGNDLNTIEKAIRETKPKVEHAMPITPATIEAGKILENAERNVDESQSKRKTEEAILLIEADATVKTNLPL